MRQTQLEMIQVEVAYALPHTQSIIALEVRQGTTAMEAVLKSGMLEKYPEIAIPGMVIGIFGKKTTAHQVLKALDRVEIYRPLLANPKEARRQRAAAKNGKRNSS